jgi:lipid-A-disaccharide synthase
MAALKKRIPNVSFVGIGGPQMQREGFDAWWPAEKLAIHGYAEALRHYRELSSIRRQLCARLRRERPAAFIGIDAPDFNLWLERRMKEAGIPAIHYVSPSVWAWRAGRLNKIGKSVSHLLALFPFEPEIYHRQGIPVSYVGHPLADTIPFAVNRAEAKERMEVTKAQPVFALLPGSRQAEVRHMAATLIGTAKLLFARFPDAEFLVPLISRETRQIFETAIWQAGAEDLPLRLVFGHAREALAAADTAIVASGTATLEAALLKVPMVIAYRMAPISWRLMRRMRLQPWVGLPNILAGRFIVPEFLQDEATPENLAQAAGNLVLDTSVRKRLVEAYSSMHRLLQQNTAEKAAAAILPYLQAAS